MSLSGYAFDNRILDEPAAFDTLSEPYFHAGHSTVGCLLLHGIGGTPANMRVIAEALQSRGFTVYVPLLPGHGTTVRALQASTGEQWLACARDGYDRLRAVGCTRIVPIGLSLGGILAGLIAAERDCAALCLISAPIRMRAYLHVARVLSPLLPAIRFSQADIDRNTCNL